MIRVFSLSEPGGHAENEDAFDLRRLDLGEDSYVCAVADGQGGRSGAASAARVACQSCVAAALRHSTAALLDPLTWGSILQASDAAVDRDPKAGYTTLAGFHVTASMICGGSSGDSAVLLMNSDGAAVVLTERQKKNPPVGSGGAPFVPFIAKLTSPWTVLAMTDGVWKYAGWENVIRIASARGDESIITDIRACAALKDGGLQDDFTLVALLADAT